MKIKKMNILFLLAINAAFSFSAMSMEEGDFPYGEDYGYYAFDDYQEEKGENVTRNRKDAPKKPRRTKNPACENCRRMHRACDKKAPCGTCAARGMEHECSLFTGKERIDHHFSSWRIPSQPAPSGPEKPLKKRKAVIEADYGLDKEEEKQENAALRRYIENIEKELTDTKRELTDTKRQLKETKACLKVANHVQKTTSGLLERQRNENAELHAELRSIRVSQQYNLYSPSAGTTPSLTAGKSEGKKVYLSVSEKRPQSDDGVQDPLGIVARWFEKIDQPGDQNADYPDPQWASD